MPGRMSDAEFGLFAQYVLSLSGISLDASKRYLLETRLDDLMRELGCATYTDLYSRSRAAPDKAIERRIVDAVSTNETSFFRHPKFFDLLKHKVLPDLFGNDPAKPLGIWSAASSTAQEAYSIAMVLEELLFDLAKCKVRIVGTDISEAAVNTANRGEYSNYELGRGLDAKLLGKYFVPSGQNQKVRDDLRLVCRFQVDNLLAPKTSGPFDVILCRNVLIYFSPQDKTKVLDNLLARLKPTGVLIVGATESVLGLTERVRRHEYHDATYYTLK